MLYMATRDDSFRTVGARLHADITRHTRVPGGHASVRDVSTKALEDHQHSFFLAEACKYLYLLFDDSFMDGRLGILHRGTSLAGACVAEPGG